MKRKELIRHLEQNGCQWLREGGSHSWWHHVVTSRRSSVPRHNEISNHLARKICRDLGIPEPEHF